MRKHLFFSVMLSLCTFGGISVYPTPAMATVAQSPTIKVRGQVIDEQGEPMPGATVRVKKWTRRNHHRLKRKLPTGGSRKLYPFDKLCGLQGT